MEEKKTVTCVGLNGEKTEVPLEQLSFRPSVYGVIVRDGKVLLSSQWDGWDFPGGGMHIGESIDEALEREVKEESGLSVKRDKLLHVKDHLFTHPDAERHFHTVLIYYTCKDISGEISTDGFSTGEKLYAREAQWIPLANVSGLKFYNQVDSPALIRMAVEGRGAES
jgi:ADP-ribose pyrophosphatase YjhB (NUDIX family)